jgi:hypothetical protein
MATHAFSFTVSLIINSIRNTSSKEIAKEMLLRLLTFHRGTILEEEIFAIIDIFKRSEDVIEAVFASGALPEESARRMLFLYSKKSEYEKYRKLVDKAYKKGHVALLEKKNKTAIDGLPRQANA